MARTKHRIFIVDDDAAHNDMLRKFLLEKFDFEIMSFGSGEDALRNMTLEPAFVALDYYLNRSAGGNAVGPDVLRQIRQTHPETFVILMSDQDKIDVAADAAKYGAFDYVVKYPSGFLRMENTFNHLLRLLRDRATIKAWRRSALILAGVFLLLAFLAVVLVETGVFNA